MRWNLFTIKLVSIVVVIWMAVHGVVKISQIISIFAIGFGSLLFRLLTHGVLDDLDCVIYELFLCNTGKYSWTIINHSSYICSSKKETNHIFILNFQFSLGFLRNTGTKGHNPRQNVFISLNLSGRFSPPTHLSYQLLQRESTKRGFRKDHIPRNHRGNGFLTPGKHQETLTQSLS